MTQPEKKTIEEILEMSGLERIAYLLSLSDAERKAIDKELLKASPVDTVQKLVNNLNKNIKADNS